MSTGVVAKRSPEQRAHDVSNALNWLRHKGTSNASKYDPTGDFKKLDSLIPSKSGQSPMERARELEGALDWCSNNDVSPCDDDFSHFFNKIGSVPVTERSQEQRANDLSCFLNWIRSVKLDSLDSPDGEFRKLDDLLPIQMGQSSEDRARDI